jgi:hypothetical protein
VLFHDDYYHRNIQSNLILAAVISITQRLYQLLSGYINYSAVISITQRLYQLLSGYINYSAIISITQRLYQLLSGYINYSAIISITQRLYQLLIYMNHFGGVMVIVLASSAVDREFEPRSGQTKHYQIGIFCFSTKHAALSRNSKDWLARNRDNMSEWGVMYIRELLFQ